MGREIRRVIPNWEHPRHTRDTVPYGNDKRIGEFRPLYDDPYIQPA
jgi:hypothetical protein